MLFRELVLHDVGVYRGRQILPLATTPDRPVVLIGGLNGCGKTTLLDSLQLVMYGSRARCSGRAGRSYEEFLRSLINHKASPEDGAAIRLSFSVELEGLTHEYVVHRSWRVAGKKVRESLEVRFDGRHSRSLSEGCGRSTSRNFFPSRSPACSSSTARKSKHSPTRNELPRSCAPPSTPCSASGLSTSSAPTSLPCSAVKSSPAMTEASEHRVADASGRSSRTRKPSSMQSRSPAGSWKSSTTSPSLTCPRSEDAFLRDGGALFEEHQRLEYEYASATSSVTSLRSDLQRLADGALPLALVGQLVVDRRRKQT